MFLALNLYVLALCCGWSRSVTLKPKNKLEINVLILAFSAIWACFLNR